MASKYKRERFIAAWRPIGNAPWKSKRWYHLHGWHIGDGFVVRINNFLRESDLKYFLIFKII